MSGFIYHDLKTTYVRESPLQELRRVTKNCAMKIEGFYEIASNAEIEWQTRMDSINPEYTSSISSRTDQGIEYLTELLEMPICANTTAFKGRWKSVIVALEVDTCRDLGRITVGIKILKFIILQNVVHFF